MLAAGHGYREHIRRIGEEKLDASGDKRYPGNAPVGCGTIPRCHGASKCRAVLVRQYRQDLSPRPQRPTSVSPRGGSSHVRTISLCPFPILATFGGFVWHLAVLLQPTLSL